MCCKESIPFPKPQEGHDLSRLGGALEVHELHFGVPAHLTKSRFLPRGGAFEVRSRQTLLDAL